MNSIPFKIEIPTSKKIFESKKTAKELNAASKYENEMQGVTLSDADGCICIENGCVDNDLVNDLVNDYADNCFLGDKVIDCMDACKVF